VVSGALVTWETLRETEWIQLAAVETPQKPTGTLVGLTRT